MGGEPLLRKDLFKLIAYAKDLGFNVFIATNATLVTKEVAKELKRHEVGVVVSLDAMNPEVHDYIRSVQGSFKMAMEGVRNLISEDLYVHINLTVSKLNLNEASKVLKYGASINTYTDFLYCFIPIGRGEEGGLLLSVEELVYLLETLRLEQSNIKSTVVPIALPQYWAYLLKLRKVNSKVFIDLFGRLFGGCSAGRGMLYVKPNGDIWPRPFPPHNFR